MNRVQKTLNNVNYFLEQLCYVNLQHKSYTTSTNIYKRKKHYVYLTSEDNNKDYVRDNPGISRSQQL